MIADWGSEIAQADKVDWITVTVYLIAAVLSGFAANAAWLRREARERLFWRATMTLLIILGINELLDLQFILTDVVRAHAKESGWYAQHRQAQFLFISGLAACSIIACVATLWFTARAHAMVRLATFGLVFIGAFVLVRAASFHKVDTFLSNSGPWMSWGTLQEVGGIVIVGTAAALYAYKRRPPGRR